MTFSANGNIGLNSGGTAGDNGWASLMNANLDALDALVQCVVKDTALATPPGSPSNGDAYIVASSPTGAWAGQATKIAVWVGRSSAWAFYAPKNGWEAWSIADGAKFRYTGSAWVVTNNIIAQPDCRLLLSAAQSIPNNAVTNVTWDAEDYDPSGMHSTSSNTDRVVIAVPGIYLVVGAIDFATNATGRRGLRIFKNGTVIPGTNNLIAAQTGGDTIVPSSALVQIAASDFITFGAFQDSGGSLALGVAACSVGVSLIRRY